MGIFTKDSDLKKAYTIGKQLGSGNFAVVKKCVRKSDNVKCAVKIIDKSKVEDMADIEREIEIMEMIGEHKHVIKLYQIFDEPKKMNLVMELVTGGELFDRIVARGNFTEKDAAKILGQVLDALHHMHALKVVHRDLKPENILMADASDDAPIKIADFGLARLVSAKDMMKTACGTPGYVAPEILKNKGYDSGAVDLWSTGVILYIMICGFPPFYEEELPKLFDQILNARYDFPSPWWDSVSPDAKSLVKALLTVDTDKRLDAKGAMEHAWIQSASDKAVLDGARSALKKYNASRRLKKAAHAVIANNKLSRALEGLRLASGSAAGAGSSG